MTGLAGFADGFADRVALAGTRRSWHGLAELVLAGPQYRRSGTIRLRITPGGFATVAEPDLRVDVDHLIVGKPADDGRRVALAGRTYAELGELIGVDVGEPTALYGGGPDVPPHEQVTVDPAAARYLAECFALGDAALRAFALRAFELRAFEPAATPVLWPEHFDVAITADEINYGVSPGDGHLDEPYAYVGPWHRRTGQFFNAPFGAARPLRELPDADAIVEFFAAGRAAAAEGT